MFSHATTLSLSPTPPHDPACPLPSLPLPIHSFHPPPSTGLMCSQTHVEKNYLQKSICLREFLILSYTSLPPTPPSPSYFPSPLFPSLLSPLPPPPSRFPISKLIFFSGLFLTTYLSILLSACNYMYLFIYIYICKFYISHGYYVLDQYVHNAYMNMYVYVYCINICKFL